MTDEAKTELRFLALELTKIARKDKVSFEKVAREYIKNVFKLEEIIMESVRKAEKKKNMVQKGKKLNFR
ncbi:MAG: hypothetical protein QXV83_03975 [Candidatus Anstonellaceae archaeon]